MAIYVKQSGQEVDVHENSIEYVTSLGWTKKGAKEEAKIAPKKVPKKTTKFKD